MFERYRVCGPPSDLDARCADRRFLAWVQHREDDDGDSIKLPPLVHKRPGGRSIHDGQREATPVTPSHHASHHASRWKNYVQNTSYPPGTAHSEKVDANWLAEQGDLNTPWLANAGNTENGTVQGTAEDQEALWSNTKKKRRIWYKRIHVRTSRGCDDVGEGGMFSFWTRADDFCCPADHASEQSDCSANLPRHHLAIVSPCALTRREYIPPQQQIQLPPETVDNNGNSRGCNCARVHHLDHL